MIPNAGFEPKTKYVKAKDYLQKVLSLFERENKNLKQTICQSWKPVHICSKYYKYYNKKITIALSVASTISL